MGKRRSENSNGGTVSLTDLEIDFFIDEVAAFDLLDVVPADSGLTETVR